MHLPLPQHMSIWLVVTGLGSLVDVLALHIQDLVGFADRVSSKALPFWPLKAV